MTRREATTHLLHQGLDTLDAAAHLLECLLLAAYPVLEVADPYDQDDPRWASSRLLAANSLLLATDQLRFAISRFRAQTCTPHERDPLPF